MATEVFVKPFGRFCAQSIQMSLLDRLARARYIGFANCFPMKSSSLSTIDRTFEHLRLGLSHTLAELTYLAGSIVEEDRPITSSAVVEITADAGVSFFCRKYTPEQPWKYTFEELRARNFPLSCLLDPNLVPAGSPLGTDLDGFIKREPCLVAQANFIEGGLLLYTWLHHNASDGTGMGVFLERWACYTAAIAQDKALSPSPLPVEVLDRTRLAGDASGSVNNDRFPEFKLVEPNKISSSSARKTSGPSVDVSRAVWSISLAKQAELKVLATTDSTSWVSTGDAVSAILWRHVTYARQREHDEKYSELFPFPCNLRFRLNLHPKYVGNAAQSLAPRLTTAELCDPSANGLKRAAQQIRHSIKYAWNLETYQHFQGLVRSLPSGWSLEQHSSSVALGITNLSAFDAYNLHWGELGMIDCARFSIKRSSQSTEGLFAILPRRRDGTLEVEVVMETGALERLKGDKYFATFLHLIAE